jgi:hypothetical protein
MDMVARSALTSNLARHVSERKTHLQHCRAEGRLLDHAAELCTPTNQYVRALVKGRQTACTGTAQWPRLPIALLFDARQSFTWLASETIHHGYPMR